jgi:LEA14-like dessication related protein
MRCGPGCATLVVMNTTRFLTDRALLLTSLCLAAMLLTGCSKALAPSFEAVGVRELERDDTRSVVEFTVRATNPNNEPIPLRRVLYRVEIGDEVVFEGVRSPETTLHTYSSHEFVLPAVLPSDMLRGSIDYALIGSVQYIPPGRLSEVLFDAEIKVPEALLDLRGSIDAGG